MTRYDSLAKMKINPEGGSGTRLLFRGPGHSLAFTVQILRVEHGTRRELSTPHTNHVWKHTQAAVGSAASIRPCQQNVCRGPEVQHLIS